MGRGERERERGRRRKEEEEERKKILVRPAEKSAAEAVCVLQDGHVFLFFFVLLFFLSCLLIFLF
jgi:hypothetical protein